MTIEYSKKREYVRFRAMEIGTVFLDPKDDSINMKTESIDCEGDEINAINLATGVYDCFCDDAKVYIVDATLNIKE